MSKVEKPIFSLEEVKVKLASLNPRAELHGDDTKLAVDLKFSLTISNDVLSEFHPDLKSSLFKKSDGGELDLEAGHLSALRFPNFTSFKLSDELENYDLVVHYGIGGKSDIKLAQCQVDNFSFTAKEGGSVDMSMRVICHPKDTDIGKLCSMIQKEVDITLTHDDETEVQEKIAA